MKAKRLRETPVPVLRRPAGLPGPVGRAGLAALACLAFAWPAGARAAEKTNDAAAGTITLDECRARALAANPDLAAAREEVKAAGGAFRQSRAWPNPEISIEVEDFGGDLPHWSDSQTTWSLAQTVEPWTRRSARSEAGRWGQVAAAEGFERTRLDLMAAVERSFFELLSAQEKREIWEETAEVGDRLATTVGALVEAGDASPVEEERARAELSLIAIERSKAGFELRRARYALAALLGEDEPFFETARGSLATDFDLPSRQAILPPLERSPDLNLREAEIRRAQAAWRLEKGARIPGLTVGVGLRRFAATREKTWLASLALEIPVLDRNGGAVQEARALLEQQRAARTSAEVRLRSELQVAYETLESARVQARAIEVSLLPGAENVYLSLREGYERGKFGFLDVLDARRSLAEARLRSVEGRLSMALARIEFERLAGRPLSEMKGE